MFSVNEAIDSLLDGCRRLVETEEIDLISTLGREGSVVNKIATTAGQVFPSFGDWWDPMVGQGGDLDHQSEFIQTIDTPEGDKLYGENVENVDNYAVDSDPVVSEMSCLRCSEKILFLILSKHIYTGR